MITPVGKKILIKADKYSDEQKTSTGIIVNNEKDSIKRIGTVVNYGRDEDGDLDWLSKYGINVNDVVYFLRPLRDDYAFIDSEMNVYYLVTIDDILGLKD